MKWFKTKKNDDVFYYTNKDNEIRYAYRIRYYDAFGKRKEKRKQNFSTEKEAYRALLAVQGDLLDSNFAKVENENMTVATWFRRWLDFNEKNWKVSTYHQREICVRDQIIPLIGNHKLSNLSRITYQHDFIDKLCEQNEYAASTITLFHKIVKIGINAAVEDEIIDRNRITKVILPKIEKNDVTTDNYYDRHELQRFLECAEKDDSYTARIAFKILAATGMRKGECQALVWENIIIEDNRYFIEIKATRDKKGTRTPKTENSYRNIEISEELYNQLMKYKIWCKQVCLMYGHKFKESNGVLISQQSGTEITDTFIAAALKRVIKNNNLKEITPHGFRHSLATIYINEGIPIPTIAKILGNTPTMIMEVYSHSIHEKELEAIEISRLIVSL